MHHKIKKNYTREKNLVKTLHCILFAMAIIACFTLFSQALPQEQVDIERSIPPPIPLIQFFSHKFLHSILPPHVKCFKNLSTKISPQIQRFGRIFSLGPGLFKFCQLLRKTKTISILLCPFSLSGHTYLLQDCAAFTNCKYSKS